FPLRRQARLPTRALPISISQPARWCLRNDGLAEGLVIRFDPR
ncbi:MAG: hypothetical protein RLZZ127_348, partial [Planctomycetota bacterium]